MSQRFPWRAETCSRPAITGVIVAMIMLMAPASALANESETTDSVEQLLARIAAEREALEATRRQHDDVQTELEALRKRLDALEAETVERSERLRRLEDATER